jgi:hypothetical protein
MPEGASVMLWEASHSSGELLEAHRGNQLRKTLCR